MAEAGSGGDTSLKRQATYTHKRMNNGVHDLLTIGSGTEKTREAVKPIYVRTFTLSSCSRTLKRGADKIEFSGRALRSHLWRGRLGISESAAVAERKRQALLELR